MSPRPRIGIPFTRISCHTVLLRTLDESQRNELIRKYRNIADIQSPFPPDTSPAGTEYSFTLIARDGDQRGHEIIRFSYPEYDGITVHAYDEVTRFEPPQDDICLMVGYREIKVGDDKRHHPHRDTPSGQRVTAFAEV